MSPIPTWSGAGFLPPWIANPAHSAGRSPYRASMLEFVQRFAITDARIIICQGLLDYRAELRKLGVHGFQWLDGSFVEDVENFRPAKPHPGDIDVVTFADFSPADDPRLVSLKSSAKTNMHVDGYFVSTCAPGPQIVQNTAYWFGLFSHRRGDGLWKGMVEVDLGSDDNDALQHLESVQSAGDP